ncbi:MAG: ribonuclease P protein component [Deltaproteobacteria bacterium]|nr:ribonuclease P protein component [Deltaproteobacteria bacterium]
MGPFSFSKKERLLNRSDFVNLNRFGKRYHTNHFVVIGKRNELGITRLGVTVGKKVGNAVRRNRIKRLVREFFRLHKTHFPQGYDIVIIAKKDASHLDLRSVEKELGEIVSEATFSI